MNAHLYRRYRLLAAIAALVALALYAAPARPASAQATPDWYAWNLKIDFPGAAPRVILTTYQGEGGITTPAAVTSESMVDISGDCRSFGGLTVGGGKATFAANAYIRCRLPASAIPRDQCSTKMSPFYWAAARLKINAASVSNPIFELVNGSSNTTARFSLPVSGGKGRSQLILPGASYLSAQWNLGATDNRVVMGAGGPSIVSVSNSFAADGWLSFLTKPQWQSFMNGLPANKVGSWSEPQMTGWQGNRVAESWPDTQDIYIGYSPSGGTYFTGTMWDGEIDPGCTAK